VQHVVQFPNLLAVVAMPQEASAVSTKVYEFLDHALNLHDTLLSRHECSMWCFFYVLARVAMPQEASAVSTKVYEFLDHALNLQETIQSRHAGRMW